MKKSHYTQDAEQEVLYLAFTNSINEQGKEFYKNWINKVKKNKLANYERLNRKFIYVQDNDYADYTEQPGLIDKSNEKLINKISIEQALATLKTEDLAIIRLHYFRGYTLIEVSKELGMSEVQVFKRHERIKQALKKHFVPPPP